MNCLRRWRIGVMLAVAWCGRLAPVAGAESPPAATDRPFVTLFAASESRFRSACEVIFSSVDRPDLFDSMDSRLKRYNDFAGIDRDKPLGIMFAWGKDAMPFVVFLPVTDIDDLLTTATFRAVGSHKISDGHYEIERPAKPYQVLVRKDYAFIAELEQTIQALRATPDQLTRRLREHCDLAVSFDLQQIPQSDKRQLVKTLRTAIEPVLQTRDVESSESGAFRKAVGLLLLQAIERATMDTKTLTIGIRLSPDDEQLHIEVEVEAIPKSVMAKACNQCSPRKSPFSSFLQLGSETAAAGVLNLSGVNIFQGSRTGEGKLLPQNSHLDATVQLIGERLGDLSLVAAVQGSDMKALNEVLPDVLIKASEAGPIEPTDEDFESFRGVSMQTLASPSLPESVTNWIGSAPEMILGQGKQAFWFGIGSPTNLNQDLKDVIEVAEESSLEQTAVPIVQLQVKGRALPELVASNLLIPNMDAERVREELSRGEDGVTVKIEAVANGLKLQADFESGFVRLMGRDWIQQIESLYQRQEGADRRMAD